MANIKSQKKRIITAEKARQRNRAVRSELKTAVKAVRAAVDAKDVEAEARRSELSGAQSRIAEQEARDTADRPWARSRTVRCMTGCAFAFCLMIFFRKTMQPYPDRIVYVAK